MTVVERNSVMVLACVIAAATTASLALDPAAVITVLAAPVTVAICMLLFGVFRGQPAATLLHLFVAAFLMHAVFRVRGYQDKEADFQVILKIGLWITVAAVALFHVRTWAHLVLRPVNLPWLLFVIWLFATALVSTNPLYTSVSAFTIFACVVFCAYLFSVFDRTAVLATIVLAIVAFCIVSIIVYFVVPEFGHYVYWVNNERFLSPRLAGIAGSANNMALVAAFALVVAGVCFKELQYWNRVLVPVTAVVCGAALWMTNSRATLVMVPIILLSTYSLGRKRLYAGLFILSAGMLTLAILLPVGQETLLKAISRSGDLGEVTSFTGRTEIWYAVLKLIEASPWMGYGYGSSIFVLPEHAHDVGFATSHAHNLLLQLLLTTGIVGASLFMLSMSGIAFRAIAERDKLVFSMLAFVLLNGITESSGFTTLANVCSLAFAIAVTYPSGTKLHEDHCSYQRGLS